MSESRRTATVHFTDPGVYRIVVQGALDERYHDRVSGMNVDFEGLEHDGSVTTLVGRLLDQTDLSGVLNTLYELHLPLLSIERLA